MERTEACMRIQWPLRWCPLLPDPKSIASSTYGSICSNCLPRCSDAGKRIHRSNQGHTLSINLYIHLPLCQYTYRSIYISVNLWYYIYPIWSSLINQFVQLFRCLSIYSRVHQSIWSCTNQSIHSNSWSNLPAHVHLSLIHSLIGQ